MALWGDFRPGKQAVCLVVQNQLINEYIAQRMMSSNESGGKQGNVCAGDALYTFKCKRRFERIEKRVEKMRKLMEKPGRGLKAG